MTLKLPLACFLGLAATASCAPEATETVNVEQAGDVESDAELVKLLNEKKFQKTFFYTGPATPEDAQLMILTVESAIRDVLEMTAPRDPELVRSRLNRMNDQIDLLDTEDRERVYSYSIKIWRAAGFTEESKLFGVPDSSVLADRF